MTTVYETLVTETCCNCGIVFGMTKGFQAEAIRQRRNKTFYCPNGHPQHYLGESDAQKLRNAQDELERQKARTQREVDQRNAAERSAQGFKIAASRARNERDRIKTRVQNGVCPCCQRTFQNLAKHMKTKHPEPK